MPLFLCTRTSIIVRIIPTTWYFVIWASTSCTAVCVHVHRARDDLQHFQHRTLPLFTIYVILCMSLFLDKARARGAQICYPYVPVPWCLTIRSRGEHLYHRSLGVGLLGDSGDAQMENSVPWKQAHRAGPLG